MGVRVVVARAPFAAVVAAEDEGRVEVMGTWLSSAPVCGVAGEASRAAGAPAGDVRCLEGEDAAERAAGEGVREAGRTVAAGAGCGEGEAAGRRAEETFDEAEAREDEEEGREPAAALARGVAADAAGEARLVVAVVGCTDDVA